jgi:hypothetical protein
MSWLKTKITAVLREKKNAATPLKAMMEEVLIEYAKRRDNGHLRVHDENGEGVLFGTRKNAAVNTQTQAFELSCSSKTFVEKDEEAFSRGLFNQKRVMIGKSEAIFISYEAPLLRRFRGHGGGVCKLDLVALTADDLWAIEYKQTSNPVTSVRFGVLEALAYGFLLALHLRDSNENMHRQIEKCKKERGPFPVSTLLKASAVKFAIAAPPAFYRKDFCTNERLRLTAAISKLASEYADDASNLFRLNLSFGGFLVVGDDDTQLTGEPLSDNTNDVITRFNPSLTAVPVYSDIGDLHASINNNDFRTQN